MSRSPSAVVRFDEWLAPAGPVLGFIQSLVSGLPHLLDDVTGDAEALRAGAEHWRSSATSVRRAADQERAARQRVLAAWEGEAAEAFNQSMTAANTYLSELAQQFDDTATLLDQAAQVVQECEDMVVQIFKELLAWLIITLIVALSSSWITFGASWLAGAGAGALETSVAATRAAKIGAELARGLRAAEVFLTRASETARAYKLTKITKIGAKDWMHARYATKAGYELLATNWVIKKALVEPTVGKPIRDVSGADGTINWPSVL